MIKRRLVDPSMPDHTHWYRVIGAVYLRERRARQFDAMAEFQSRMVAVDAPQPTMVVNRGDWPQPQLTDEERYRRWLESGA